jgi:hypothetical protein
MDEKNASPPAVDVESVVRQAVEEYARKEQAKAEPAYKAELEEERRRREHLERRVNELVEENRRARQLAEETDRHAAIRSELQRLGVSKVDLAFRAVRDDVVRTEDGRLVGRGDQGELGLRDYLAGFVSANPEFLPARIPGGSGMTSGQKAPAELGGGVDLDKIRPGMSREEMERARQEVARIASQTLKGM